MVRRLLQLNGLAILGAVLYHASGWGFTAMFWWTDRYLPVSVPNFSQLGGIPYYGLRLVEQLIIFSIPAFLFVSGFFIAFATGRDQETVGWQVVGTRVKNLAIPYLLWTVLIILANVLQGQPYSLTQILGEIFFGKASAPYYFVPLIIQFYLLSPFLIRMARKHVRLLLVLAILLQLTVQILKYLNALGFEFIAAEPLRTFTASWFFPGHIFWFVLGILVKFNLPAIKEWVQRYKWALLSFWVILIPLGMWEWEALIRHSAEGWLAPQPTILDDICSLTFLLCYLAFEWFPFPRTKLFQELGPRSFGIYLSHSPVLEYASRGMYHFLPWILGVQVLFQPVLVVLGITIPLLLMKVVARSPLNRYYTSIFG